MQLDALSLEYIPPRLLFRQEMVKKIVQGVFPKVIHGPPETGKTTTIRFMEKNNLATVVQCGRRFYDGFVPVLGRRPADLGQALLAVYEQTPDDKAVIFDDVQAFIRRDASLLNDLLKTIRDAYPERKTCVATNLLRTQLVQRLTPEVQSRWGHSVPSILFERYDALQVKEILLQRVEAAGAMQQVEVPAIALLAAKVHSGERMLRDALLFLKAGLASGVRVTEKMIGEEMENTAVLDFVAEYKQLPLHDTLWLGSVACAQQNLGRDPGFGEVYGLYNAICSGARTHALSPSSITKDIKPHLSDIGRLQLRETGRSGLGRGYTTYSKVVGDVGVLAKAFRQFLKETYSFEDGQLGLLGPEERAPSGGGV